MAVNVNTLVNWDEMGDDVAETMKPYYAQLFELSYDDAGSVIGDALDFDLSNPQVKKTLSSLAKQIKSVADTTRDEIRGLVGRATEEGWSVGKLAAQIREHGDNMSKSRSLLISRTESGTGYNLGATLAYEQAGLSKVDVLDGDDDEACSSVNGTTQTLEWARANPLGHPNCTRAFLPHLD